MVLRSVNQLRANIKALMADRHINQTALAFALGLHKSQINKFLSGKRSLAMESLDRLADVFGLSAFELFRPGISPLTERRKGRDRRSGRDRRLSIEVRGVHNLQHQLAREPSPHALSPSIRAAVLDLERAIDRLLSEADAGGQTPPARPTVPTAPRRRRVNGRPDAGEIED